MKKTASIVGLMFILALLCPVSASAHVVVTPAQAIGNSYQTFSMSVPTERDLATVKLRLVLPEGVTSARPNVKPGWNISFAKETMGTSTVIKEITWAGGSIPAGLRDEFLFSIKTPASGTLVWKAYQTYSDGTVVSWDQESAEHGSMAMTAQTTSGPFSQTIIIEQKGGDMSGHGGHGASAIAGQAEGSHGNHPGHDLIIPLIALGLAVLALHEIIVMKRKEN